MCESRHVIEVILDLYYHHPEFIKAVLVFVVRRLREDNYCDTEIASIGGITALPTEAVRSIVDSLVLHLRYTQTKKEFADFADCLIR